MKFKDFLNETSAGLKSGISGDDVNANLKRMENIYADCIERIKVANETAEKFLDSLQDYHREIEKTCFERSKIKKSRAIVNDLTKIVSEIKRFTR